MVLSPYKTGQNDWKNGDWTNTVVRAFLEGKHLLLDDVNNGSAKKLIYGGIDPASIRSWTPNGMD